MKVFVLNVSIATMLLVVVVRGLNTLPIDFGVVDPLEQALSDFEMTDLVFSQFSDDRPVRLDTNIVIVNIGGSGVSREDIATALDIVARRQPAVIGVDVLFDPTIRNGLDTIRAVLQQHQNIVLAIKIQEDSTTQIAIPRTAIDIPFRSGHVNWPDAEQGYRTVRRYEPYRTSKQQRLPSFALAIASAYDPFVQDVVDARQHEAESIAFQKQRTWWTLSVTDILRNPQVAEFARGRIILFGYLGEVLGDTMSVEDRFWTPLNHAYAGRSHPDMYGVEIHANIISTLLHRDFIDTVSETTVSFAFIVVILLNVALFAFVEQRLGSFYDVICKTVQIVESIALLILALFLFEAQRLVVPVSDTILGVILASDIFSVYLSFARAAPTLRRKLMTTLQRFTSTGAT